MVQQVEVLLPGFSYGIHLITHIIENKLPELPQKGIANFFLQHTSAALSINENADPSVRNDMEMFFDNMVPENTDYFTHTIEGNDDMPAHVKTTVVGSSLCIPITNKQLNMGTWQGIYLCEFRRMGGKRKMIITITGE